MPTLAYEIDGTRYAGRLTGRALVGRRLSHGVVLADPGVSRLHAWVDPTPDGTWAVTDAGSQTGTFVNDRPVYQHALRDGDVVRVGSTRVTFRADGDALPPGADPVVLTPVPGDRVHTSGVLFDCVCGAPIWAGNNLVGKRGRCRHCQRQIVVPAPVAERSPPSAQPVAPPPTEPTLPATARRLQCGVCHALIAGTEEMTACPECDTTYHAECWTENYGCSTYGCGHVNVLNPAAVPAPRPSDLTAADDDDAAEAEVPAADDEPAEPRTSWELLAVLAAVATSVVGALLFGVPALAMAVASAVMLVRRRPETRVGLVVLATVIAVVGCLGGLAVSDYWWFAGAHLPKFIPR